METMAEKRRDELLRFSDGEMLSFCRLFNGFMFLLAYG
jgi:hypothetical protein